MNTVNKTLDEAKVINANSDFGEVEYLQASTGQGSNDQPQGNVSNRQRVMLLDLTEDRHVKGLYRRYPSNKGDERLVVVNVTSGNYHLFGIGIDSNANQGITILKQRGYKESGATGSEDSGFIERAFRKYDVRISLGIDTSSQTIKKISIGTDTHVNPAQGVE